MSDETTPPARETPHDAVVDELRRYGDQLIPGAAEILAQRNPSLAQLPPERRAERVAELVASPLWKNFRNPEHVAPTLENGAPVSPLRAALTRNADRLKPDQVDALTAKLAPAMVGKSPSQVAGAVAKWLNSREADDYKPGYTVHSQAEDQIVTTLMAKFGDVLSFDGARKFAADRVRDLQRLPERQLTATIARAFSAPAVATKYGARGTIQADDPRLQGRAPASQASLPEPERPRGTPDPSKAARAADGRFQQPPPKRRPTSTF